MTGWVVLGAAVGATAAPVAESEGALSAVAGGGPPCGAPAIGDTTGGTVGVATGVGTAVGASGATAPPVCWESSVGDGVAVATGRGDAVGAGVALAWWPTALTWTGAAAAVRWMTSGA